MGIYNRGKWALTLTLTIKVSFEEQETNFAFLRERVPKSRGRDWLLEQIPIDLYWGISDQAHWGCEHDDVYAGAQLARKELQRRESSGCLL